MKPKRILLLTITAVLVLCTACGVWLHVQRQQYERNRQLMDALKHNDLKTALALVNAGADPNTPYDASSADSLLQQFRRWLHPSPAPVFGSPTVFLLACGGDMHLRYDEDVYTNKTVQQMRLVQAMLSHGANVRAEDWIGKSVLDYAVSNGRLHVAELLLKQGMSVNAPDGQGKTPLIYAVVEKNDSMMGLLLAHHADPNTPDRAGFAPLHYAVSFHCPVSIFRMLLAPGADPDRPDKNGQTPLMLAQKTNRPDLVALMRRGGK